MTQHITSINIVPPVPAIMDMNRYRKSIELVYGMCKIGSFLGGLWDDTYIHPYYKFNNIMDQNKLAKIIKHICNGIPTWCFEYSQTLGQYDYHCMGPAWNLNEAADFAPILDMDGSTDIIAKLGDNAGCIGHIKPISLSYMIIMSLIAPYSSFNIYRAKPSMNDNHEYHEYMLHMNSALELVNDGQTKASEFMVAELKYSEQYNKNNPILLTFDDFEPGTFIQKYGHLSIFSYWLNVDIAIIKRALYKISIDQLMNIIDKSYTIGKGNMKILEHTRAYDISDKCWPFIVRKLMIVPID